MDLPLNDTVRDAGFAGFCLFALKEILKMLGKINGRENGNGHHDGAEADRRIEMALSGLTEAVKSQTTMFCQLIETQNKLLAEMHREQVDQKATLAKLEARHDRWRD